MLRGTTSAVSLEQSTDATGAIQQHIVTDRVLLHETTAAAADVAAMDVKSITLEAAQLYPFVTEKTSSEQTLTDNHLQSTVELPSDPLDPTWGRPSDRDRTLISPEEKKQRTIVADFGVPSRLMQNQDEQIALVSVAGGGGAGMAALSMMAANASVFQQLPVLLAGGLLAFAVAGVIVNRMRRSSKLNHHHQSKAFDDEKEIFESDDDNEKGYALFS